MTYSGAIYELLTIKSTSDQPDKNLEDIILVYRVPGRGRGNGSVSSPVVVKLTLYPLDGY